MPESLAFSATVSSPTPASSTFLSPGVSALASSQPTSPSSIDQHKSNIIAKGKVKAKDPPQAPKSPNVKPSGSQSPSASSSPKHNAPPEYPTTAELHLNQYITRDLLHAAAIHTQAQQLLELSRSKRKEIEFYQALRRERQINPGAVFGYGYQGYGNGYTNAKQSKILYPCERRKPGSRTSRELRISRSSLQAQAEEGECLVPIRLEIDHDKYRLRDTFTWNLHDRTVPIELFAAQLVEDFRLPSLPPLINMIVEQIHAQVTDFHPHVHLPDEPLDPKLPYWAYKNDEMRVLIKLNITIGQYTLVDQFEWDINNPGNSPEGFAQQMARDMCLSGEFTTAIAHSIREQCQLYTKYLYQTGHTFDGRPVEDPELKSAMLPSPLPSIVRPLGQAKEYEPVLYELSDGELEKIEKDWSRESRRKRRVNRRGGPSLPDLKEMPKTNRSQILSTILPGAVTKVSDMKVTSEKPNEPDSEDDSESDTAVATPPPTAPSSLLLKRRGLRQQVRSQTPELSQLPHLLHHTPSSQFPRRPGAPKNVDSVLVKLRIGRDRLGKWTREQEKREQAKQEREAAEFEKSQREKQLRQQQRLQQQQQQLQQQQQQQQQNKMAIRGNNSTPAEAGRSNTPSQSASAEIKQEASASGTSLTQAPTTPAQTQAQTTAPTPQQNGGDADPAHPPPCPDWLEAGLSELRKQHPNDNFEGIMRYTAIDGITGQPVTGQNPPTDPNNVRHRFFPRIKCHDCPGKLYTPGPEKTVDNFKLHLNNRGHRTRVEERVKASNGGR